MFGEQVPTWRGYAVGALFEVTGSEVDRMVRYFMSYPSDGRGVAFFCNYRPLGRELLFFNMNWCYAGGSYGTEGTAM